VRNRLCDLMTRLAVIVTVTGVCTGVAAAAVVVAAPRRAVYVAPARHPAAVATTAVVVGATVHTLPPHCSAVVVGNVAYKQCGSTWYQPHYAGSQVNYVVVTAPR
jgi:hypothetical protein